MILKLRVCVALTVGLTFLTCAVSLNNPYYDQFSILPDHGEVALVELLFKEYNLFQNESDIPFSPCSNLIHISTGNQVMDGWHVSTHSKLDTSRQSPTNQTNSSERVDAAHSLKTRLTVLLPTYNEEQAIVPVLEEIISALSSEDIAYEVLIVDDASTDQTIERAEQFAANCWQCAVRILKRAENGGAGAARKTGIRAAHGDWIVMLDADGTYPANCIPKLLEHFPMYDQVNGARTSEQGTLPWLRMPAKWIIRKLACYLTGKNIPDLNTGLKAFKREAMLKWLWVVPDGFSCVTTMTLAFLTNGHPVKYIPIPYRKRIGVSKFHPIKDTLAYVSTVIRIVMYFRPLKVFLPIGFLTMLLGMLKSVASFYFTGSMQESDVTILMCGFMTCMLGLLAEVNVAHHRR